MTKRQDLDYNKLETQNYLKPAAGLTKTEVSEIMMCRSRMVPVKANFKSSHNAADLKCRACGDTEELQQHLISCRILNNNSVSINTEDNYEDLFSNNTESIAKISRRICSQNKKLQALISVPV